MTTKSFVIGHPIAHSKSPLIHGYWLEQLGIAGDYQALDVAPADLPTLFDDLRRGEYLGGNVTLPHKEAVIKMCDIVAPEAVEIGAVNTLVAKQGAVHGTNTDLYGFLSNLDQQAPNWDRESETAIVLGAGGAARAILIALRNRGFSQIHILNRTLERAQSLANELKGPFQAHRFEAFADLAPSASFLVNTTSIGMHGTKFDDVDLGLLKSDAVVTDIVYTPMITPLLATASARGLKTVDGLGMLLHQAVPGFEAWYGKRPEVTLKLRQLIETAMEDK